MSSYRKERINDAVAQELSIALRAARDPVLAASFVSVTRAEVAADLKNAKIFVSFLSGEEKEVLTALKRAAGMLRRHLATTLNLRITPELYFVSDRSLAHGAHIASLLNQIQEDDKRIANERAKAGAASEDGE